MTDAPAVVNAVWLRTLEEGLYSVAISDLAAQLGKPEKNMRRRAENGTLSLTNNKQPASWHYDAESDSLLFVCSRGKNDGWPGPDNCAHGLPR